MRAAARTLVTLLLFFQIFSAADSTYQDPPISEVISANMNTAVLLSSNYDLNFSEIYVIDLHWANITVNGSMAIAGITLLIGNSTTYGSDTAIITEQGYGTGHLIGSDGRICDDSRNDYDLRCDFDGDGCAEIEKKSDVSIDTKVEFVFRGMSENASAAAGHTNVFALPENISKMMESASGNETLQAVLHGAIRFAYTIDNKTKHGGACATKPMVIEQSLLFNSSFSCLAAGKNKLIIIESPATNDQWFRNNKLSLLVLSERMLYHAKLQENNATIAENRLCYFNVSENRFGIKEISILENDSSPFMGIVNVTPFQLEKENNTYAYLYRFNYTYGNGLGKNDFRLEADDVFNGNASNEQKIFSKQLSYGNRTETGSAGSWETTRKSIVFERQAVQFVTILFGALGVVIIIMLLRFRLR